MERQESVLVIGDSAENLEHIQALLRVSGYHVTTASSSEEAIDRVAELPPDLIMLEVIRPALNGFELCARLKGDESTRLIPVVLVGPSAEHKSRGFEAGMDGFLQWPVNHA